MKLNFFLILCVSSFSVNAESKVNQLLVKYCGQSKYKLVQSVTIGSIKAIGYHRNGYLNIQQEVKDEQLKLELAKMTRKIGLDTECIEFLDAVSLLTFNNDNMEKGLIARVYFDFDRYSLTPESKEILDFLTMRFKGNTNTLQIIGHTDSTGSYKYNIDLGMRRANETKEYLVENGLTSVFFKVASQGESNPLESDGTVDGRKINRRVDIY